jgi:hypothetical protein
MTYPTLSAVVQQMIIDAGLVSGTSVQTYAEPQAESAVNKIFDFLWNKAKWPHLWDWQTVTLDGSTGKFTAALTGVRQWEDVGLIRVGGSTGQGVAIPRSFDNRHLYATGSQGRFWTPLPWDDADADTKFVKIWPITSTGTLDIHCGHRPETFTGEDTVPFDKSVLSLGALWYMIAADGLNPSAADVAQGMFDVAYQDYVSRIAPKEIGHGSTGRRPSDYFSIQ